MKSKPRTKKPGTVTKLIKQTPAEPEKAQIELHEGEELYREIRIENTLEDGTGKKVKLKPGVEVDVTIEADPKDTTEK